MDLTKLVVSGSKRTTYNKLDSSRREIRLLEIIPSNSESKYVQCRVHTVGLDDDPVYCALSYVWGDQSVKRQDIVVDNEIMPMMPNLVSALRAVRKSTPVRCWAEYCEFKEAI